MEIAINPIVTVLVFFVPPMLSLMGRFWQMTKWHIRAIAWSVSVLSVLGVALYTNSFEWIFILENLAPTVIAMEGVYQLVYKSTGIAESLRGGVL